MTGSSCGRGLGDAAELTIAAPKIAALSPLFVTCSAGPPAWSMPLSTLFPPCRRWTAVRRQAVCVAAAAVRIRADAPRVQVEVEWFMACPSRLGAVQTPVGGGARPAAFAVLRFSEADAQAIKDIETTTNHDVRRSSCGSSRGCRGMPNWPRQVNSCTSPAPAKTSTTPATR